jgi:hypothetical protein
MEILFSKAFDYTEARKENKGLMTPYQFDLYYI